MNKIRKILIITLFINVLYSQNVFNYDPLKLPVSSEIIEKINSSKIGNTIFEEYSCGLGTAYGYYLKKIEEYDIFIVNNDCGDFPFRDLITIKDNEIISKLLIESDSWDIEKDEKGIRDEEINSFKIDNNLIIEVITIEKLNGVIKSRATALYQIIAGKFVKK